MTTLQNYVKYDFVAGLRKIAVVLLAFSNDYISAFEQLFACNEASYVKA